MNEPMQDIHYIALRKVWHEISHKHGGPEAKDCVSIDYLYRIVAEALGQKIKPKCERCFLDDCTESSE